MRGRKCQEQFLQAVVEHSSGAAHRQEGGSEGRQGPRADLAWWKDTWGRKGQEGGQDPDAGTGSPPLMFLGVWCVAREYVRSPELGKGEVTLRLGASSGLQPSGLWDTGQAYSLQKGIPTVCAAPRRQQEAPQRQGEGASLAQPGN